MNMFLRLLRILININNKTSLIIYRKNMCNNLLHTIHITHIGTYT